MKARSEARDMGNVFPFYWHVPTSFSWTDGPPRQTEKRKTTGKGQDQPRGAERLLVWKPEPARQYQPLRDELALFLALANTEPTEEAVLNFAARYGPLGGIGRVFTRPAEIMVGDIVFDQVAHGEPLTAWVREITALGEVVRLWRVLGSGTSTELAKLLGDADGLRATRNLIADSSPSMTTGPWPDVAGDSEMAPHAKALVGSSGDPERSLSAKELQQIGWLSLSQSITARIKGYTEPCLIGSEAIAHPRLHVVPKTLLGAAWLQLALAISGDKEYRACESCRAWLPIVPGEGYTVTRRFCSTLCRVRASRRKRRQHGKG